MILFNDYYIKFNMSIGSYFKSSFFIYKTLMVLFSFNDIEKAYYYMLDLSLHVSENPSSANTVIFIS
jgi:hypothetical protein